MEKSLKLLLNEIEERIQVLEEAREIMCTQCRMVAPGTKTYRSYLCRNCEKWRDLCSCIAKKITDSSLGVEKK